MQTRLLLLSFLFVHQFLSARLPDLIPYRQGTQWGYCDSTKKLIIPCHFQQAGLFTGDSAIGVLDNQNGYIMKNGDFHPSPPFVPSIYPYDVSIIPWWPITSYVVWTYPQVKCTGLFTTSDSASNLIGFQNCKGKIVIPCKYIEARSFVNGLAYVRVSDTLQGFINEKGKLVLPFNTNYGLNDFNNHTCIVTLDSKQGVINEKGEFIIPPICDEIVDGGNFFFVRNYSSDSYLLLNKNGKWEDHRMYNVVEQGENNIWKVACDYKYGFFNGNGKQITPMKYWDATAFANGSAMVTDSNGFWGMINETGKEFVPTKYTSITALDENFFVVIDNFSFYGLIDKKGNIIFPLQYLDIQNFYQGLSRTEDSLSHFGFLNEKGQVVIPFKYANALNFQNGFAAVADENERWGFVDLQGKQIIPFRYSFPANNGFDENGLCKLTDEGYIDIHGTEYWEPST